jgi:hypothetical protein
MNTENNVNMTQSEIKETAIALITKAEIETAVATARAFPRSLTLFAQKATSMVSLNEEVAAACTYVLPRGGSRIEGKSVRFAEIVVAAYGNIRAASRIIANDGKWITAQGICRDLESNTETSVEVKRRITDRNGNTYSEDMQTMTGNAAAKIAYRNAVFTIIPSAFVDPIYFKAKEIARGSAETLPSRRDKAVAFFKSKGVTEKQICDILDIAKVGDIDLDKLEILTGMKTLLNNGEATIKELFETPSTNLEDLEELFELKKVTLSADELSNAERIIKNKEESSYKKLQNLLKSK